MVAANAVFTSAEWRTALGITPATAATVLVPTQSWGRAISRHLRLSALVGDVVPSRSPPRASTTVAASSRSSNNGSNDNGTMAASASSSEHGRRTSSVPPHPLHCAASQGMLEAGAALLAEPEFDLQNSTIEICDMSGRSALHWAAMVGHVAFAAMLLEKARENAPSSPLDEYVSSIIDTRDVAGRTPLIYSCAFGAVGIVSLLLAKGADKDGADDRGLTPLHAAAAAGHVEVARVLLLSGADHERVANVGATPRHVAERQGNRVMMKLLSGRADSNGNGSHSLPWARRHSADAAAFGNAHGQLRQQQRQQRRQKQFLASRHSATLMPSIRRSFLSDMSSESNGATAAATC